MRALDRQARDNLDEIDIRRLLRIAHDGFRQDDGHRAVIQSLDRTADQSADLWHQEFQIDIGFVFDEHGRRRRLDRLAKLRLFRQDNMDSG
ncbi:hypothetical protein D3C87_1913000 [compost metagenome]